METRNILAMVAAIFIFGLVVTAVYQDKRITNLEKQQLRIEQEYQAVVTENRKLRRLNETNLRLMSQGGWNGFDPILTVSAGN